MLIENPESLRTWLTSMLQPLCDADPAALAKYVLALIKKDKPEAELRKSMIDQLDVFLQQETTGFVDLLFVTLANKNYLSEAIDPTTGNDADMKPSSPAVAEAAVVNENNNDSARKSIESSESSVAATKSSAAVAESSLHIKPEKSVVSIKKESTKKDDEKDRDNRAHRRSRSPRRSPPRGHDRRQRSRSPRDRDRDMYRGRHRGRKSPPRGRYDRRDDQWDRSRRSDRRSPARNRSASPPPRTRSPRYRRYHSRSRSPVNRDRSPNREKTEKAEVSTPTTDAEAMEVPESKSQLQSVVCAVNTSEKGEAYTGSTSSSNKRCRDFDEKGLCMRGELCEFDHGTDPVVLEDISVSPRTAPADYMSGPGNAYAPQMLRPSMPMIGGPSMDPMCWGPGMPPPFRPRHMGGMRHRMPLPRPPMGFPMMPARELISVPVTGEGSADPSMMEMHPMGPPLHMGMPMPPRMRGMHQVRGSRRGGFDHGRLGMKPARNFANTSLEVKKIPRDLNNIMDLNSHFLRFGKIVNIQINFENDPEAALITFASPVEANLAYRSTEAVLNNRFIRVFWHNKEKENEEGMELGNPELGGPALGKDRLGFVEGGEDMEQEKILVSGNNLTKTVYNPGLLAKKAEEKVLAVEAIKKSQEALSQLEHQKKVKEESQRNARKLMVDLRKRKQDMLHQQIEQQKKLISKLEHCKNKSEKDGLMSLIKSLQESIESIKKELDESAKIQIGVAVQPVVKPKEEPVLSQKDLLDAELDLIQREQEGGDTNALQKKIFELRAQAHPRGGIRGRGSSAFRGSTRGTFVAGAGRGRGNGKRFRLLRKVDRRPTTIRVTGFSADRLKDVLSHFSIFGPIAYYDANPVIPSLTLTFESRKKAEIAFVNGKKFEDTILNLDWEQTSSSGTDKGSMDASNGGQPINHDDENNVSMEEEDMSDVYADELLFQYDDEEEEDDERSWRR